MSVKKRVDRRAFAFLGSLFAVGLWLAVPVLAATKNVTLQNDTQFHPPTITITKGDSVRWTHKGTTTPHSVTEIHGEWDSDPDCTRTATAGCMHGGDKFARKFDEVGTVRYYCKIHGEVTGDTCSGMCGTVNVKAAATPPPTTKPPVKTTAAPPATQPAPTQAAAPVTTSSKPSATPSASPTPTPSVEPTSLVSPIGSPLVSPIAFGTAEPVSRGPIIGIAVGAVVAAGAAGLLYWLRVRGSAIAGRSGVEPDPPSRG